MMNPLRLASIVTVLLAALTGCSLTPVYTGSRTVTLKVATPLGATSGGRGMLGANLETLRVEVTGADFAKVDTVLTPTSPGVYDAKVTVPVGKGRTFTVTARDAGGKGYATGTTVADLTQPSATVAVTLAPVTAGAPVVTASGYTADFTGLATGEVARVVFEPVVATTQGFQASLTDAALAVVNAAGAVVARGSSGWTMTSGSSVVLLYTKTGAAPALSVATMAGTPVLYDANGADGGSVPVDPALYVDGQSVTILGAGTLVKAGYNLAGWMTAVDGSGSSYAPTSVFAKPTGAVTLHAVWVPNYLVMINLPGPLAVSGYSAGLPSSVTIPEGVEYITMPGFSGATGMTSISLPNSLVDIYNYSFQGTGLVTCTVPPKVTRIGISAFDGCANLVSVVLPPSLVSIGAMAFSGCPLTSITIPESVTSVGNDLFLGCTALTSVTLPSHWTAIPGVFFNGCSNLQTVDLPEVLTLAGWTFRNCTKLTSVTIPKVTSIGYGAFEGAGLTSVSGPSTTSIADLAFVNCTALSSASFPVLKTIGNRVFDGSGLVSYTLAASVTSLDANAFGNSSLTTLTLESPTPPTVTGGTLLLPSTNPGFTIRVPAAGLTAYQAGPNGWSSYSAFYVAY